MTSGTSTELTWDYLGWKPATETSIAQNDWNQTLITIINQMSGKIAKRSYRGGNDKIIVNEDVLNLLKTLEYFHGKDGQYFIGARYEIIVDNSLPSNKILVNKYDKLFESLKDKHPTLRMVYLFEEDPSDKFISEIKFTFLDINSDEYKKEIENPNNIVITSELLSGEITILNYG